LVEPKSREKSAKFRDPICLFSTWRVKISLRLVENLGLKINTTTEVFKGFFPKKVWKF